MSKSTTPKTNSQQEKPVKQKKNGKKKISKAEVKPKTHSKKIEKILSDMFSNKSAKFIRLHQAGLRTSEIAELTNSHPSFVHGVIARFRAKK